MHKVLVCGAGGFIGNHLVDRLKIEGAFVVGADIKYPEFSKSNADQFNLGDLRDWNFVSDLISKPFDEVYQLAANMGGAGFVFSGENDADIMSSSTLININILKRLAQVGSDKVFFSSSACVYPASNQSDT